MTSTSLDASLPALRTVYGMHKSMPNGVNICVFNKTLGKDKVKSERVSGLSGSLYDRSPRRNGSSGRENMSSGRENITPGRENITSGSKNITSGRENIVPGRENIVSGRENIVPGSKNITSGC